MNPNFCPTCHTAIPDHAPGGFCPACLLRDADDSPTQVRLAPSVAEISIAFPQWEILALIGEGGMGFVYQIRQPALDRIVALKILSPELSRDPAFAERFAREARVLGKLNHPNIVTVYESGESGGFFYLVMEYVDGVNLRQAMRAGRFTPQQALAVVPGICDALQAAHAQGVWHRDIKPENILLDAQGNVKIVDFGIARLVGDPRRDFTLTRTGAALGSAAYMAPEQHEKPHDVDHRADIYSLGVVIYEMLTGELPLGRFPAPSAKAAVDARIDEIVFRTLEKEREMRQQSATEVKTDMQNAAVAPKAPAPSVIDFSSWKLVLAAVVFSYIGTAWDTPSEPDDVMPQTTVGLFRPWLRLYTIATSVDDPISLCFNSFSAIAMILAGVCWLRWFWMKRMRKQDLASFLLVKGPGFALKVTCIWVSAVAFFLWAWMAVTGLYLCLGILLIGRFYLDAPVREFLFAGVASGTVWTLFKTLHASSSFNSSKTSDSTHEKENVVRKQTVADEADSHKEIPSIHPTILLHAILFVVVAVFLVIVLPRFAEIFREIDAPRSQIPIVGIFQSPEFVLLMPVLFGIDVGLCFLARKMGGRRGLRLWSVTAILLMVTTVGATLGALQLQLKSVIDNLGGSTSAPLVDVTIWKYLILAIVCGVIWALYHVLRSSVRRNTPPTPPGIPLEARNEHKESKKHGKYVRPTLLGGVLLLLPSLIMVKGSTQSFFLVISLFAILCSSIVLILDVGGNDDYDETKAASLTVRSHRLFWLGMAMFVTGFLLPQASRIMANTDFPILSLKFVPHELWKFLILIGLLYLLIGWSGMFRAIWKMYHHYISRKRLKLTLFCLFLPFLMWSPLMMTANAMNRYIEDASDGIMGNEDWSSTSSDQVDMREWLLGEWLLDGDASKHGVSNMPITKNLTDALAYIQASESGQMLLTITPELIAWTTKSEKAWKPTQQLRMENGKAFLLLKLPDGQSSTMVRFDRHDENTLLITPLEGDRTSNGPVPRYTLVFKRKSFGNAEKNQESIWESKSAFGPVVECSLYFSDNMRAYLDFQSGESLRSEWVLSAIPIEEAQKNWLELTGVDAYAIKPINHTPSHPNGVVLHELPHLSSWNGGCVFAPVIPHQSLDNPQVEDMEATLKDAADTQALMGGTY